MTQEPTGLRCNMYLSMENLIDQDKKIPFEKRCHHGVTVFPTFDAAGYLASPDLTQEKTQHE